MPPPRQVHASSDHPSSSGGSQPSAEKAGKRKAVSSACVQCRKRKSKCDGARPACSTCVAVYRSDCTYEAETDQPRKSTSSKGVDALQTRQTSIDVIISALRDRPENEALALFYDLRGQRSLEELGRTIRQQNESSSSVTTASSSFGSTIASPSLQSYGMQLDREALIRSARTTSPSAPSDTLWSTSTSAARSRQASDSWFYSPQDPSFVSLLLDFYFARHHHFHCLFSAVLFLKDYEMARTKYCSSLLLYAVLSTGCTYVEKTDSRLEGIDASAMGDSYFTQALALADINTEAGLTTVQALGVMGLREACRGRERRCYRLIGRAMRMSIDMGLHLGPETDTNTRLDPLETEIRKLTFWGIHNVEVLAALSIGRISQLPSSAISIDKVLNVDNPQSMVHQAYEEVPSRTEAALETVAFCINFNNHYSDLCRIVNDCNLALTLPKELLNQQRLRAMHDRYQAWYASLPEDLSLNGAGSLRTSMLQMHYHSSLLLLFRPFLKTDMTPVGLHAHMICSQCAFTISTLADRLNGSHDVRRLPASVIKSLEAAAIIHALNQANNITASHLAALIYSLRVLSNFHPLASRSLQVLRLFTEEQHLPVPEMLLTLVDGPTPAPYDPVTSESMAFRVYATLGDDMRQPSLPAAMSDQYRARFDSGAVPQQFVPWGPHGSAMPLQTGVEAAYPMTWGPYAAAQDGVTALPPYPAHSPSEANVYGFRPHS